MRERENETGVLCFAHIFQLDSSVLHFNFCFFYPSHFFLSFVYSLSPSCPCICTSSLCFLFFPSLFKSLLPQLSVSFVVCLAQYCVHDLILSSTARHVKLRHLVHVHKPTALLALTVHLILMVKHMYAPQ
jgi:hypothetical protein